eukprot:CAMPEP_0177633146 /NCGR_PEP_ID=MMETSP0447-20121125/2677_1 /TAXON_ID=0 /ORGANISM="Stygamoeba regulata, Strain BSH-02190019" /LENGTH=179 /DNA_ID=CAMNT_0019134777 /DNA_START=457 /DNA_END=996 /DNA_ORIENTATION=+
MVMFLLLSVYLSSLFSLREQEDVEKVVSDITELPGLLQKLDSNHRLYKQIEADVAARRDAMQMKIPQIQKALAMLDLLDQQEKDKPLDTHFEISDTVYANASVEKPEHVCLWIGAGVLLQYKFEEAHELLRKNLKTAHEKLASLEETLDFLKEQAITTEVNMSRLYNYQVQLRRQSQLR